MGDSSLDSTFARALAQEIVASERMRVRVLASALAILLIAQQVLFLSSFRDTLQQFAHKTLPPWLPLWAIGPFLAYEVIVLFILRYRASRGLDMPAPARFANAVIETSLPTAILWWVDAYAGPAVAFSTWPSMLYFFFIVASTLRLNFVLPVLTGAVAAAGYLMMAYLLVPFQSVAADPVFIPAYHWIKAALMLAAGIAAGLVALRLGAKFRSAVEATAARERVINLFGQHVSPAVVDRLLASPADFGGERREICVMFLDIRNFTANARERHPEEVVDFLNTTFAFMIEAIDRHGGFINKFLGDGFMAIFGAPLADPSAARNAVAAAHDILAEIDRRGLAQGKWPLRIGIGLHVGQAVTGNVGSPRRKEFTAIGDTVNLASRLEQLTKEYQARLIVSDAVVQALGESRSPHAALGAVQVRGYAQPIPIWRLDEVPLPGGERAG
jgi:adenylate cyclase